MSFLTAEYFLVKNTDSNFVVLLCPKNILSKVTLILIKKDTLGLKTLDESGRLVKLSVDGDHLQFTQKWFEDNIIKQFLLDPN